MTSDPTDWTQEAELDPEKEYRALVRSIRYSRGFGLLFVQCSPAEGTRLIDRVREDLPTKKIEVLTLEEPIDNLYDVVNALPEREKINALFIRGIEHSLYEYEKEQLWHDSSEQRNYSQKSIPRLLGHLNLGRERFREHFKICFVFLVPKFVLKYLSRRAPDFFDWRSGVLEFTLDEDLLQEEYEVIRSRKYVDYIELTPQQRREEIFKIQALVEELKQTTKQKCALYVEQGLLHAASKEYENAIISFDKALEIKSEYYSAWYNRGIALSDLGRHKEAIVSFNKALEIKPDYYAALYNWGTALNILGRYEEAIASFDKALAIESDSCMAWHSRGAALGKLGQFEEAIMSFDKALEIKLDYYAAWRDRGVALGKLGRYEGAIAAFNRALEINPSDYIVWNMRDYALTETGRYEEAFINCNNLLEVRPRYVSAWNNRGIALAHMKQYTEAIASFDYALQLDPNAYYVLASKAECYVLQGAVDSAIEHLQKAINIEPDKCRDWARTDPDLESIRNDDRFQALINETQNE